MKFRIFQIFRELPVRCLVLIAAMQRIHRSLSRFISRVLSLALACLVLVWAGVASAEEAYESAAELVEHVQVDQVAQGGVEPDTPEPQDCPAFVSGFALPVLFLLEVRPDGALPEFPSVFPRATSPPPLRS